MLYTKTLVLTHLTLAAIAGTCMAVPQVITLPVPDGATYSRPQCISGDGRVIYGDSNVTAYVWSDLIGLIPIESPFGNAHMVACSRDGSLAAGWGFTGGHYAAMQWTNHVPFVLPPVDVERSTRAVSADSDVVVGFTAGPNGNDAASWTGGGSAAYLGEGLNWISSNANDVSADGKSIVGTYSSLATFGRREVFLLNSTGFHGLGVPMDLNSNPPRPYEYSRAVDGLFVTDDGQTVIAQFQHPTNSNWRIFRRTVTSDWEPIGLPPGDVSFVLYTVNGPGTALAGYMQRGSVAEAYILNATAGWINVHQYLVDNGVPPTGEPLMITGISDDGIRIVGHNYNNGYLIVMGDLPCPADFNGDGVLNFFDYLDFVDAFALEDPRAEFNRDGVIDFFDYLDFVDRFSIGC